VHGSLGLTGFAHEHLALMAALRELFGLGPETLSLLFKAIRERENILETASLHGAAPILRKAGAQPAISSPIAA
jgi:hypothetical protein